MKTIWSNKGENSNDDFSQLPPEERKLPRTCMAMAKEAAKQKLWLFDPSIKAWHTPEEFIKRYENVSFGDPKFLNQIELKCPLEGIRAGYQQLNSIQMRLEEFTKRVVNYYKNKQSD